MLSLPTDREQGKEEAQVLCSGAAVSLPTVLSPEGLLGPDRAHSWQGETCTLSLGGDEMEGRSAFWELHFVATHETPAEEVFGIP